MIGTSRGSARKYKIRPVRPAKTRARRIDGRRATAPLRDGRRDAGRGRCRGDRTSGCAAPASPTPKALLLVRVLMPPGTGHQFHRHPAMEEIIYVVSGTRRAVGGPGVTARSRAGDIGAHPARRRPRHLQRRRRHARVPRDPVAGDVRGPGAGRRPSEEPWASLRRRWRSQRVTACRPSCSIGTLDTKGAGVRVRSRSHPCARGHDTLVDGPRHPGRARRSRPTSRRGRGARRRRRRSPRCARAAIAAPRSTSCSAAPRARAGALRRAAASTACSGSAAAAARR